MRSTKSEPAVAIAGVERVSLDVTSLARSTMSKELARSIISGDKRDGSAGTLRGLLDGAAASSA